MRIVTYKFRRILVANYANEIILKKKKLSLKMFVSNHNIHNQNYEEL